MFSWRSRRQIIASLIVLSPILILIVYGVYKFIPSPTCFDNVKNQGEVGVDCGGPCAPCELKNPANLTVFWSRALESRQNFYDAAAFIGNNNQQIGADKIDYTFSFSDSRGVISEIHGTSFILPQERAYIIEPNIPLARKPNNVRFRIDKINWQLSSSLSPNILVEQKKLGEESFFSAKQTVLDMILKNNTSNDFKKVELDIVIFDSNKNSIGFNKISLADFLSESEKKVRAVWPGILSGKVGSIEVDARVNLFID